ncbi:interferon lambda receptor 1 [Macrotis lagotis]|uniref:interferon lambda receptor 1 n=1 Tax=Macrotis lagotis TaxID=92651 RepID=UPI003D6948CA
MAGGSLWAPLLLCLLPPALGSPVLARPQNVTLIFRNFSVYLAWCPGSNYPNNITYTVNYQSIENERWRKVKHCMRITMEECNLTCLKHQDLYLKFKARVRAMAPGIHSTWVESPILDYFFDVEPAPPILTWIWNKEMLSINATYELPHCVGLMSLKYEVEFWKEGNPNKNRAQAISHDEEVKIPLSSVSTGNYCLSARTIYFINTLKYSNFSQPICFLLGTPGTQERMLVLVLLLFLPIAILSWMFFLKSIYFQKAKMPQNLDFSSSRCPVKTLELNRQESFRDLLICPKNNLCNRRRPYSGSRSQNIPQPSEMEDHETEEESEEEESEDTDDSGTFEPYLRIPPLEGLVIGMGEAETNVENLESTGTPLRCDFSLVIDTSDSGNVFDSSWGESDKTSCLIKDSISGDNLCLSSSMFLKESKIIKEYSEDALSSRASPVPLDLSSPGLMILPEEPLASLKTLVITMDRSEEEEDWFMEGEEEEDKEEEEMTNGNEMEGLWNEYPKRPKVRDYQQIHYRLH